MVEQNHMTAEVGTDVDDAVGGRDERAEESQHGASCTVGAVNSLTSCQVARVRSM